MKYKHDIEEEEKGHEHYEHMAKGKFKKQFRSMAEDEEKHENMLKKMAKRKALKNKTK